MEIKDNVPEILHKKSKKFGVHVFRSQQVLESPFGKSFLVSHQLCTSGNTNESFLVMKTTQAPQRSPLPVCSVPWSLFTNFL